MLFRDRTDVMHYGAKVQVSNSLFRILRVFRPFLNEHGSCVSACSTVTLLRIRLLPISIHESGLS